MRKYRFKKGKIIVGTQLEIELERKPRRKSIVVLITANKINQQTSQNTEGKQDNG